MKKPRRISKSRRRVYAPRKRKQVTFADVCELTGTEYYLSETGVRFLLEEVVEQVTLGQLLQKFYRLNFEQPALVFRCIPDIHSPVQGAKVWQIVMRGSFFMDIEEGSSTAGPHRCRLWFRSFTQPIKNYWLASCQIMSFFFNEQEMREAVAQAVDQRQFSMLPQNEDVIINP